MWVSGIQPQQISGKKTLHRVRFFFFLRVLPICNLFLCFVLGDTVSFLDSADQLVTLARNHFEVIIGELSPLLFDIALELLPVTFNAVPVHFGFLCVGYWVN